MEWIRLLLAVVGAAFSAIALFFALRLHKRSRERLLAVRTAPQPMRLPVAHVEALCRNCAHFDLEGGQNKMRYAGPFMTGVAPYIAPNEYHAKNTESGETIPVAEIPAAASWEHFGLCEKRAELVWKNQDLEKRTKFFPQIDDVQGGDCFEAKS